MNRYSSSPRRIQSWEFIQSIVKSTGQECFKMSTVLFYFCIMCKFCILNYCPETFLSSITCCFLSLSHFLSFQCCDFSCLSPRLCIQLLLILSAKWGFSFQGMDNIISFILCSIFGCAALPWWSDMPVVVFSACRKRSFCILKRAWTLWSFDSAQQERRPMSRSTKCSEAV